MSDGMDWDETRMCDLQLQGEWSLGKATNTGPDIQVASASSVPPIDKGEALTRAGMRISDESDEAHQHPDPVSESYGRGLDRALRILQEEYERH